MAKKKETKLKSSQLSPSYKLEYNGVEFEAKIGLRALMKYSALFGYSYGSGEIDQFNEMIQLFYTVTVLYGKFDDLSYDEFVETLEDDPEIMQSYVEFFIKLSQLSIKNQGE